MIPGLDGLRAVAFLLVFAVHTDYLNFGWTGVQLFFVLSGFLITGILLEMKEHLPAGAYFVRFYGRRFLRIFPLYYFYLFLMVAVTTFLLAHGYRPNYMRLFREQLPYALAYIYNFFYSSSLFEHHKYLEHFWSLSVEEQFYVFWPLVVFLTPKRHLKKLFLGAITLGPAMRIALAILYRAHPFDLLGQDVATGIYPLPLSHIDAFAWGALITQDPIRHAREKFYALLLAVPSLGFLAQWVATGSLGEWHTLGYPFAMPHAAQFIWGYSILNYWFAIVIYGVAREGWFLRFLEWGPIRYLGKISYGLYVYHLAIIWFVARIRDLGIENEGIAKPLTAGIALIVTVLVASLSYFALEKPILSLKDRFFPRRN